MTLSSQWSTNNNNKTMESNRTRLPLGAYYASWLVSVLMAVPLGTAQVLQSSPMHVLVATSIA